MKCNNYNLQQYTVKFGGNKLLVVHFIDVVTIPRLDNKSRGVLSIRSVNKSLCWGSTVGKLLNGDHW